MILVHMDKIGSKKWKMIASQLNKNFPGSHRNRKQCRERWVNNLDQCVKSTEWTIEEELRLLKAHKKCGNKWAEIRDYLPGRSAKQIKNQFCNALRTQIQLVKNDKIPASVFKDQRALEYVSYMATHLESIAEEKEIDPDAIK